MRSWYFYEHVYKTNYDTYQNYTFTIVILYVLYVFGISVSRIIQYISFRSVFYYNLNELLAVEKKVNDQSKYVITKRIAILLLTKIYIFGTKYRDRWSITTYGKIEHQLKFVPADHRITRRYLDQPRLTLNFLSTCLALEFSTCSNIFNLSRSHWHVLQFPLNL